MLPSQYDIELRRGSTFTKELVCQNKIYLFATSPEYIGDNDVYRSHAENLEKYGYTYEYIDFLTTYDKAVMTLRKPWIKQGDEGIPALFELSTEAGTIELTNTSVKLYIPADVTEAFTFDGATYDLELYIEGAEVDGSDIVDKLVFGEIKVVGELTV